MRGYLIVNGKSLADFYVWYDGSREFQTPARKYEKVTIPGRSGDLIIAEDAWENIDIPFSCLIRENFPQNYAALLSFLHSTPKYVRIETTAQPDIYRMGAFLEATEPNTGPYNYRGRFTLAFDCKPQKWLKSGEIAIPVDDSAAVTVNNPTSFTALPLIKVTAGTGTITINNTVVQLTANNGATIIDSEMQECYEGTTNRNGDLVLTTGEFPQLVPGTNTIEVGEDMEIELIPRWWRI